MRIYIITFVILIKHFFNAIFRRFLFIWYYKWTRPCFSENNIIIIMNYDRYDNKIL